MNIKVAAFTVSGKSSNTKCAFVTCQCDKYPHLTGPRSAVGNVSGYRYVSDCRSADPGVAGSIPVRSHTFVEIDHEIISTVILLPSADLFKKGCCQIQAKVCARITG